MKAVISRVGVVDAGVVRAGIFHVMIRRDEVLPRGAGMVVPAVDVNLPGLVINLVGVIFEFIHHEPLCLIQMSWVSGR
jgi:hypothetical protein